MSDQPPTDGSLQFERADFGHESPPAVLCGACGREIGSVYYEAGGQTLCEACQINLSTFLASRAGTAEVIKAVGAGLGAGLAGWLLYYAVLRLSGYEFGLIAVVVGWAVGRAVRWGSGGRGGRGFQAIAVIITYISIVSTSVPAVLDALRTQEAKEASATTDSGGAASGSAVTPADAPADGASPALALVFFAGLILALPFLQGFENILGIAILGFGVYEAWRVNRRLSLAVTGPFTPGPRPAA